MQDQYTIKTIFIADDDEDDRSMFRYAVNELDSVSLTEVGDGKELLSLLQNVKPDILFLDLDMPSVNGLQAMQQIRDTRQLQDIPIVVFSSTTRGNNIDTAYAIGADLFFIKPSTFTDLKNAIKGILDLDWSNPSQVKERYFENGHYKAFTIASPANPS